MPPPEASDEHGLVGVGADLRPGTLLAAYRQGLFPMPASKRHMGWWSPDPRGILPVDGLVVSRSLRKSCARFEVRFDTAFAAVIDECADRRRPGAWITADIRRAYIDLYDLGWAHSVETWQDGRLVGGLYGIAIDGLFAGESMFHRATDASKVALIALVEHMNSRDMPLLDVQWCTTHLTTLGAVSIPRTEYLERLASALTCGARW
ncbi:MAG: leucyl/phenylalanyl-tRNA--protein transferase [Acidimicrobiia bacterium]